MSLTLSRPSEFTLTFPSECPLTLSAWDVVHILNELKTNPPTDCDQFVLKWGISSLRIFLLGGFFVRNNNVTVKSFESDKLEKIVAMIRRVHHWAPNFVYINAVLMSKQNFLIVNTFVYDNITFRCTITYYLFWNKRRNMDSIILFSHTCGYHMVYLLLINNK